MAVVIDCGTGHETVEQGPVLSVAARKLDMIESIKALRDARIASGATVQGIGVFDSDDAARLNITGAVVMAQVAIASGAPFTMTWKLANNNLVTLNAQQMIAVGLAAGTHVAACHAQAQVLGVAVQNAADHAALDALNINIGWPD